MQLDLLHNAPPLPLPATPSAPLEKIMPAITPPIESAPSAAEPSVEEKAAGAFKTISEAADSLSVPQHVLRFWESRFKQIKPLKLRGGRRYYRPEDMTILYTIKNLLYKEGYTIEGAKKAFRGHQHPAEQLPVIEAKKPAPAHNQLAALRQELMGLRDALKPHVF